MIHPAWLMTMLLATAAAAAPVKEELLDWHVEQFFSVPLSRADYYCMTLSLYSKMLLQ